MNAYPANRTDMKAYDTTVITSAYLKEAGREGQFLLKDYAGIAAEVDADTQQGIFVRSTFDATKVWVRPSSGPLNVLWFMDVVPPDTAGWDSLDGGNKRGPNRLAMGNAVYTGIAAAWAFALTTGRDLYFPAGRYEISGERNMPFGQSGAITSLFDCRGITLCGDGDLSILATNSQDGADVLQLNGLKNFHVRHLGITALVSGAASGSNGVSITNGFDNVTLLDMAIGPCPSIDKGSYADGGAGVTAQMTAAQTEWGTLLVDNVRVVGCREGFGFEGINAEAIKHRAAVSVNNLIAQDCYIGFKVVNAMASEGLSAAAWSGLSMEGKAINCQRDVVLNRAHGLKVDVETITTKNAADRRKKPDGTSWFSGDATVDALYCAYAKNSRIVVRGNKGGCDYKAQIGGAQDSASGLNGATEFCDIVMDIAGTATLADINIVADNNGNTVNQSTLSMTSRTAVDFPATAKLAANANLLQRGTVQRLMAPIISGTLSLQQSIAGNVETGVIDYGDGPLKIQGKGTGVAGANIVGLYDQAGTFRLGIRNGNGLVVDVLGTSSPIGSYVDKQPVYNAAGDLLGYFPIYK